MRCLGNRKASMRKCRSTKHKCVLAQPDWRLWTRRPLLLADSCGWCLSDLNFVKCPGLAAGSRFVCPADGGGWRRGWRSTVSDSSLEALAEIDGTVCLFFCLFSERHLRVKTSRVFGKAKKRRNICRDFWSLEVYCMTFFQSRLRRRLHFHWTIPMTKPGDFVCALKAPSCWERIFWTS